MSDKKSESKRTNEKPITLEGLEFEKVLAALLQTIPEQPLPDNAPKKPKRKPPSKDS